MSKRKSKSRFTKTDVNTICELQRKIDVYENYILCLFHHTKESSKIGEATFFMHGTDMDEWVNMAVRNIWKIKKELIAFRYREETNKIPKENEQGN